MMMMMVMMSSTGRAAADSGGSSAARAAWQAGMGPVLAPAAALPWMSHAELRACSTTLRLLPPPRPDGECGGS
eukprot:7238361-Pyramimonas_sp.AAC.1